MQHQVDAHTLTPEEGDHASAIVSRRYQAWSQATTQDRAKLIDDTNNSIAMLQTGRPAVIDNAAIRRLLPADKADAVLRQADEARAAGAAVNRVQWATPQELADQQARSLAGLNDPQDFARKQRQAKALALAIDQRQQMLDPQKGDPAAYVAQAPAVAEAVKAIDPQNPMQGTQAAIGASLAEQERLGVKPEDRRVLTKPQAAAMVREITTADPATTDIGARLDQIGKLYGSYWPRAFGDLVHAGLPPEAQILGAMDTPGQAAARADMQRTIGLIATKGGAQQLRDSAPHDAVQAIGQGLAERMAPFRATVRGDPRLYDAVQNAVKDLATYYAFRGMSGDQALQMAYDGIIGRKYDFDGTVRAPKGMLPVVERAGDALLGRLGADSLPDIGGNPDLTPAQRRGIYYLDAIRQGSWRVNENETGLYRTAKFRDGAEPPARGADGSRIEFSFADAAQLAAGDTTAPALPSPSPAALQ